MKKPIVIIILFIFTVSISFAQRQKSDSIKYDEIGIEVPPEILKRKPDDPYRVGYIETQKDRTRNRTLLDLALNYSPLSYVSGGYLDPFHPKKKPYILDADVSPQFAIGGEWLKFPILITPRYLVRIFGDDAKAGDYSEPVRTPSFMPGATIFIPLQDTITPYTKKVLFGSLAVFHHSNGQDGWEFSAPGVFNKYNGNFSTDYIEPAFWFRKRYGGDKSICPDYPGARDGYFDWFTKISYQIYFSTDDVLAPSYGSGKINISTGLVRVFNYEDHYGGTSKTPFNAPYYAERYRLLFNLCYITGARTLGLDRFDKRFGSEASFHFKIPSSPNTALMLTAGYYGSDPYNIYYADSYFYVRAGISTGLFVAPARRKIIDK